MAAFAHVASMTPASDCLDFLLHTRHEGQTHAALNAGSLQTLGGARGGAGLGRAARRLPGAPSSFPPACSPPKSIYLSCHQLSQMCPLTHGLR